MGTKGLKLLHKWCNQSNPDIGKINKLFYIVLRNLVLARYGNIIQYLIYSVYNSCRQVASEVWLQPHFSIDSPDWKLLSATRNGDFTSEQLEEKVMKYAYTYSQPGVVHIMYLAIVLSPLLKAVIPV